MAEINQSKGETEGPRVKTISQAGPMCPERMD